MGEKKNLQEEKKEDEFEGETVPEGQVGEGRKISFRMYRK